MTIAVNQMNLNPNLYAMNANNAGTVGNIEDEQVFEFGAANEAGITEGPQDTPEEFAWVAALVPAAKWLGGCIMAGVGGYLFNKAVGDC